MSLRLREKLLSLLTEPSEEKPLAKTSAPTIIVREESPAECRDDADKAPARDNAPASSSDACPRCADGLLVEIAANIRRCPQCGYQRRFEKQRAIVPPFIVKPRAKAPCACPSCGSSAPLQPIGGGGLRCQACGHQIFEHHATGLSRAALETYDGPPVSAQMNGPSFYRALAMMRGFGR